MRVTIICRIASFIYSLVLKPLTKWWTYGQKFSSRERRRYHSYVVIYCLVSKTKKTCRIKKLLEPSIHFVSPTHTALFERTGAIPTDLELIQTEKMSFCTAIWRTDGDLSTLYMMTKASCSDHVTKDAIENIRSVPHVDLLAIFHHQKLMNILLRS